MKHPPVVEQFHKDHPDAEACPNCGYKYYVNINWVTFAYEDGYCRVCHGNPNFPHKVSEFEEKDE